MEVKYFRTCCFLFAFLTVTSLSIGTSIAESQENIHERGRDYEIIKNPDGSFTYRTGGVSLWTYDGELEKYVPHKIKNQMPGYVEVQSGMIGWRIEPDRATITDSDVTYDKVIESWTFKVGEHYLEKMFLNQTVSENIEGVFVTNIYVADYSGDIVYLEITYAVYDGRPSERIVTIDGISDPSEVEMIRDWVPVIDIESIRSGSEVYDRVTDSIESISKDYGVEKSFQVTDSDDSLVVYERLYSSIDKISKVDYSENLIRFTYNNFTENPVVLIDDTFSSNNPTEDGYVRSNAQSGTSCGSTGSDKSTGSSDLDLIVWSENVNLQCARAYIEWDISSIPDTADVFDVDFKFAIEQADNPRNCDFMPMEAKPSTSSVSSIWTDIGNGTAYASNNNLCTTISSDNSVDLGSSANSDLQDNLADDYFAIGLKMTSETRDGSHRIISFWSEEGSGQPDPTLEVTYGDRRIDDLNYTTFWWNDSVNVTGEGAEGESVTVVVDGVTKCSTNIPSSNIWGCRFYTPFSIGSYNLSVTAGSLVEYTTFFVSPIYGTKPTGSLSRFVLETPFAMQEPSGAISSIIARLTISRGIP